MLLIIGVCIGIFHRIHALVIALTLDIAMQLLALQLAITFLAVNKIGRTQSAN